MNILDTGKLSLTSGLSEIDFSNTLIFMTTNLGAQEQSELHKKYSQGWRALLKRQTPSRKDCLDQALTMHFDPEFINRIDRILPFDYLEHDQLEALLDIELNKLNKRLRARNASISVDKKAREYLYLAYDTRYGARDIARLLRVELEPKLAQAMLHHPDKFEFVVSLDSGTLKVLDLKTELC